MSCLLDPLPPALLSAFYTRLSRRYGAPGVRLRNFPGRWMVFRMADLAAGIERAVVDVTPPDDQTAQDLAELESKAAFAVDEGLDATLVVMYLATGMPLVDDVHETPSTPVLTLLMWSQAHPVALGGDIELDEAGRSVRIGLPDALPRY